MLQNKIIVVIIVIIYQSQYHTMGLSKMEPLNTENRDAPVKYRITFLSDQKVYVIVLENFQFCKKYQLCFRAKMGQTIH